MKDKIISITFVSYLLIFFMLNIFTSDEITSDSERRKLEQLPEFSIKDIMKTTYMEDFDKYVLDQFVFRDNFRSIKANINYYIFQKLDNNGIYVIDNHIFKTEYPTNTKSIDNFINKLNEMNNYFTEENNVYYAIIPDKNYYLNSNKYLNIDYELLYKKIQNINYQYIELRNILTLYDYYKTDTHWKQQNLNKVANELGNHMNFEINATYTENKYSPFYGVYYGQASLNKEPDELIYLTNDTILNCEVTYLEDKTTTDVYPENKLNNIDKYDIFLGGASSFIEINNPENKTGKELVIFRDSFASSLTPLLISAYSKITLIDTRYITSDIYLDMIDFTNQDILFLYSTLIVNNSSTIKQ